MAKNSIKKFRYNEALPKKEANQPKYIKNTEKNTEPEVVEKLGWVPKYKLTENTRKLRGVLLYQIQALRSFDIVEEGQLGGWVSDQNRLSQSGNCWVDNQAAVYENGSVTGDAWATESSIVRGDAVLAGISCTFGNVVLEGKCRVAGDIHLGGDIALGGNLKLTEKEVLRLESTAELKAHLKTESQKRARK